MNIGETEPVIVERLQFIQSACEQKEPHTFSTDEIRSLVQRFIHRDEEEIGKLKKERRPGRPPSTAEQLLKQRQEKEKAEHKSGFWIPDLKDAKNVSELLTWNGEWVGLNKISFIRISDDGTEKASSFPPKGQS
jgi:translation machinery-associated protein 16